MCSSTPASPQEFLTPISLQVSFSLPVSLSHILLFSCIFFCISCTVMFQTHTHTHARFWHPPTVSRDSVQMSHRDFPFWTLIRTCGKHAWDPEENLRAHRLLFYNLISISTLTEMLRKTNCWDTVQSYELMWRAQIIYFSLGLAKLTDKLSSSYQFLYCRFCGIFWNSRGDKCEITGICWQIDI